jgi:hypothetical protein
MTEEEILNRNDIIAPRSPAEFHKWMSEKNEELSATPETTLYARSGAELPKKFYDEIYPLALFVNREFGNIQGAIVTPNLDNDNFDATIAFHDGKKIFIEITQAKDGYDDSLRMEVLAKEGAVSLTSPIIRVQGRRRSPERVVEIPPPLILKDRRETLEKNLRLVESAVRNKAGRQYGRNFILLVAVDDSWPFREDVDRAQLHQLVTSTLLLPDLDFGRLVILGVLGELLLSYKLPKYSGSINQK